LSQYQEIEHETTALKDVPKPGQPQMAAIQNYFMTLDPKEGRVPLERLEAAYNRTMELQQNATLKTDANTLEWDIVSSTMGGRTRCIVYDPSYTNKIWAGSVTGGLWYNTNITSALSPWMPVDDFWPTLAISSITFDPLDPLIMYVGTGEAFTATTIYRESSGLGMGIFKSTDGGETWNLIPSTSDFKYITDIAVRNENGNAVIYAGVVSGIYKGINHQSLPSDGLYRSVDGGQSWMQVLPLIPDSDKPYAVADIELAADGRIFIGTKRNLDDEGGATILFSDSGIIGSWTVFDDYVGIIQSDPDFYVPGRVMLAAAPSDANVVYALMGAGYVSSGNGFTYTQGKHIVRSEDGGQTWNYRPYPSGGDYYWATLAWHALAAGVDPNDPNSLYIGGLDVYKSTDGGFGWNQVSDWRGMYNGGGDDYVHGDIHCMLYKHNSSNELLISTDGGVFYTGEATSNSPDFEEKSGNFGTLQFYTCDIYPIEGDDRFIGGLQDNGTLYYTGSPLDIFDMVSGGDGCCCFIDQDEEHIMITSSQFNNFYLNLYGNQVAYLGDWSCGIFINPADYDDKENTLYTNVCSFSGSYNNFLLRIDNFPNNPNGIFYPINTNTDVWYSHVQHSPYAPAGTSNLFIGTLSGLAYKVENAETNSPDVTDITGNDFPEGNISCIAIGESEDQLLATFSNYGVTSVWQTRNGGASWQEKEGNLPDMPIRWALYHPENTQHVILATEIGIWTTSSIDDIEVTWEPNNDGLANVRIDMLQMRMSDNTVLAATHGRGLASAVWDIYTDIDEPDQLEASVLAYPNPSNGVFNLKVDEPFSTARILVFNISGQKVLDETIDEKPEITFDLSGFGAGQYVLNVEVAGKIFSEKLIVTK